MSALVSIAMRLAKHDQRATWEKLTRQGVRDLGGNDRPCPPRQIPRPCGHKRMNWCCALVNCGHWRCPDCGLSYDQGAEAMTTPKNEAPAAPFDRLAHDVGCGAEIGGDCDCSSAPAAPVVPAGDVPLLDCGDNSCAFATSKTGMRTNGGCRCLQELSNRQERAVRRYMHGLKQRAEAAEYIRISPAALSCILAGTANPAQAARERIQKFTRGLIVCADWRSDDEKERLAGVKLVPVGDLGRGKARVKRRAARRVA